MSNVYNTEPPTGGKVVLHTTHGDIDVELWTKESSKATRNFLQLCLDGYYDGMPFHRVIKNLFAQTGASRADTADVGPDIYNGQVNYLSELHSRLRFGHRGQVAMADSRGSQFFMTLGKADWLNGKHCIIGKVTGDSIYNLLKIGEVETDAHDVPTDDPPPTIKSVEVLNLGPFEELTARPDSKRAAEQRTKDAAAASGASFRPKPAITARSSAAVLSFAGGGDDEDEDGGGMAFGQARGKGTGLVGNGRATFAGSSSARPSGVSMRPAPGVGIAAPGLAVGDGDDDNGAEAPPRGAGREGSSSAVGDRVQAPAAAAPSSTASSGPGPATASSRTGKAPGPADDEYSRLIEHVRASRKALATAKEGPGAASSSSSSSSQDKAKAQDEGEGLTVLQAMRAKYMKNKRARGDREGDTLARLAVFQSTLKTVLSAPVAASAPHVEAESYHGQVMQDKDQGEGHGWREGEDKEQDGSNGQDKGEEQEGPVLSWAATAGLRFTKHIDDRYRDTGYGQGFGVGQGHGPDGDDNQDEAERARQARARAAGAGSSVQPLLGPSKAEEDDDGLMTVDPLLDGPDNDAGAGGRGGGSRGEQGRDGRRGYDRTRDRNDDQDKHMAQGGGQGLFMRGRMGQAQARAGPGAPGAGAATSAPGRSTSSSSADVDSATIAERILRQVMGGGQAGKEEQQQAARSGPAGGQGRGGQGEARHGDRDHDRNGGRDYDRGRDYRDRDRHERRDDRPRDFGGRDRYEDRDRRSRRDDGRRDDKRDRSRSRSRSRSRREESGRPYADDRDDRHGRDRDGEARRDRDVEYRGDRGRDNHRR